MLALLYSLQPPMASDWPQAFDSNGNHMIISTNVPAKRLGRKLAGNTQKHADGEGGEVQ